MLMPALARDLYKARKVVEDLEMRLAHVNDGTAEHVSLKEELRQAVAELTQLKKVMESQKEKSRSIFYHKKTY